jgi:hypothetical protein
MQEASQELIGNKKLGMEQERQFLSVIPLQDAHEL